MSYWLNNIICINIEEARCNAGFFMSDVHDNPKS